MFKTKLDLNENIGRYKAKFAVKGFTQKYGIGYKETSSPVSTKDSLESLWFFGASLELQGMNVKLSF